MRALGFSAFVFREISEQHGFPVAVFSEGELWIEGTVEVEIIVDFENTSGPGLLDAHGAGRFVIAFAGERFGAEEMVVWGSFGGAESGDEGEWICFIAVKFFIGSTGSVVSGGW
ncbi:MAG: hypothetical protein AAGD22_12095 [Verrucomicrobiota bacterium]